MEWSATRAAVPQEAEEVSGVVGFTRRTRWSTASRGCSTGFTSGAHAGPLHPVDVLLILHPANGQVKVISGRVGAAETPNTCNMWSGIAVLKHSTVDVHVRNDVMLQDRVSISDAGHYT